MAIQSFQEYKRVEHLKRSLQYIAYGSLVLDVAIAMVTLASINIYKNQLASILIYLDDALTVEVVVTLILFAALMLALHYQKLQGGINKLHETVKRSIKTNKRSFKKLALFLLFVF